MRKQHRARQNAEMGKTLLREKENKSDKSEKEIKSSQCERMKCACKRSKKWMRACVCVRACMHA